MNHNDPFVRAYIEALYFTDAGGDNDIPSDADLAPETLAKIEADCAKFQELAGEMIPNGCTRPGDYSDLEMAGHDFWLTRNNHGCGFWDGDWPEVGDRLTAICKTFGESTPYLGDDVLIYLTP